MKKILTLILISFCLLSMVACGDSESSLDKDTILEDSNNNYYVNPKTVDFTASSKNTLTAVNLNNKTANKVISDEDYGNIKYLYVGDLTLNSSSEKVTYNGSQINLGLTFEIIITNSPKDSTSYLKVPGYGSDFENLTPDTLCDSDLENLYLGAAAKTTGEYKVVVAKYKSKVNGLSYGLGLVKASNVEEEETKTPVVNPTPNDPVTEVPTIPSGTYDELYDSNNGEDILPANLKLADDVQDGVILHAWNWSYANIEKSLNEIASAGYTTVQVSPVQQPKDYSAAYPKGWAQQWWKFYQPVSYSIAQESWLGTKADLISLCDAADEYGIKIIVDIVANHSASYTEKDTGSNEPNQLSEEVLKYEPELYNNSSKYIRSNAKSTNDSSIAGVVQGHLGMPELRTDSEFVQNMIIDLLKECIDCGVDGFRFDAAKHIETPDDGSYASNFWPTILTAATNYSASKDVTLYYYGEILNTPGSGRSWESYTKYMSITDNKTGDSIRNAIVSQNANSAANASYATGQAANKLVLWAESHDTYANDEQESTNVSQANINKTWALVAARKDATALYFARPGEIGTIGTYAWKSIEVASVNKFHNQFISADEKVYASGNYAVVERYSSTDCGAVIVNCKGTSGNVSINVSHLSDGSYSDEITGNVFTIKNGTLTGNIGSTGIAVVTKNDSLKAPVITLSQEGGFYSEKLELTVSLSFATNARVIIGDEVHYITETTTFTIDKQVANYDSIKVTVTAINEEYRVSKKAEFVRIDGVGKNYVVVENVPEEYLDTSKYTLYAWVWPSGKPGREIKVEVVGKYIMFKVNDTDNNFLLAANKAKYAFDWNINVVAQTSDFIISENGIYSASADKWVSSK